LEREYVAPRTELEQEVAAIWQELLRVERVGIYDNFFELGGHSLLTTQVISRVRERLNVEVPLRDLFEAPTVAGLTLAILASEVGGSDSQRDVPALLDNVSHGLQDDSEREG
jgi:acyl carrier protein